MKLKKCYYTKEEEFIGRAPAAIATLVPWFVLLHVNIEGTLTTHIGAADLSGQPCHALKIERLCGLTLPALRGYFPGERLGTHATL